MEFLGLSDLINASLGHNLALVEQNDPVHLLKKVKIVGRHHNGLILPETLENVFHDLLAYMSVECAERVINDEDI